jgi:hypothetical protein
MPCRKFLDPYRISNLIAYLEKLHAKGLAGSVSLLCGAGPNCVPSVCYADGEWDEARPQRESSMRL